MHTESVCVCVCGGGFLALLRIIVFLLPLFEIFFCFNIDVSVQSGNAHTHTPSHGVLAPLTVHMCFVVHMNTCVVHVL